MKKNDQIIVTGNGNDNSQMPPGNYVVENVGDGGIEVKGHIQNRYLVRQFVLPSQMTQTIKGTNVVLGTKVIVVQNRVLSSVLSVGSDGGVLVEVPDRHLPGSRRIQIYTHNVETLVEKIKIGNRVVKVGGRVRLKSDRDQTSEAWIAAIGEEGTLLVDVPTEVTVEMYGKRTVLVRTAVKAAQVTL